MKIMAKSLLIMSVNPYIMILELCKVGRLNSRRWVIHRILVIPKNDSNKGWPGHSIFKCTCKSNVRVYSINIDGKVFENIVLQEMVDKIKLLRVGYRCFKSSRDTLLEIPLNCIFLLTIKNWLQYASSLLDIVTSGCMQCDRLLSFNWFFYN